MAARGKANGKYQGQKWITNHRRLALYLRDGLACAYCGQGIEEGVRLTLDHIEPYSAGEKPDNSSGNLVTACVSCNSSRGTRSLPEFCQAVAGYLNHGIEGKDILAYVQGQLSRPVNPQEAKEYIARRGGFSRALATLREK